jgi:hypothetical protein
MNINYFQQSQQKASTGLIKAAILCKLHDCVYFDHILGYCLHYNLTDKFNVDLYR